MPCRAIKALSAAWLRGDHLAGSRLGAAGGNDGLYPGFTTWYISVAMRTQKIETIRRRFRSHPEWLLIRVNKTTSAPLTGRLLAHSPDRDEILQASLKCKGSILIDCSVKRLPQNYAVAF